MKYLGVDFGTKKVGLAVSDAEGRMAFPLRVIPNGKSLAKELAALCSMESVGLIVLGESLDFTGRPNPLMRKIAALASELKEHDVSVAFMSEVYSSQEAKRVTGTGKTNDASAAAIVLQSYLDRINGPARDA